MRKLNAVAGEEDNNFLNRTLLNPDTLHSELKDIF